MLRMNQFQLDAGHAADIIDIYGILNAALRARIQQINAQLAPLAALAVRDRESTDRCERVASSACPPSSGR